MSNTHLRGLLKLILEFNRFWKTAMTLGVEHQFILNYFNEKLAEDYKVKQIKIDHFKLKENNDFHFIITGKVTWLSVSSVRN